MAAYYKSRLARVINCTETIILALTPEQKLQLLEPIQRFIEICTAPDFTYDNDNSSQSE